MTIRRTANVKRNVFYGLLQTIASMLLPFIIRTVLIYRIGVEFVGLNSLFESVLSVLNLMELGFGSAVVYSMYRPAAEGDNDLICAYLAHYRKIYRLVGLAVLIIGLCLMPFLNKLVMDSVLPEGLNIYTCYLVFLGNSVISYFLFGYMTALPIAFQRKDVLDRIDIGVLLFKFIIQVLVLLLSSNIYCYLLIMPVSTIIQNLTTAKIVKTMYPELDCRGKISTKQKCNLERRVSGLLVNKLTVISRNSIDSLCISSFFGLTATGLYNNYYFVVIALLSFSGVLCNSMMASVGNSIAIEDPKKNYDDMRMLDFIYMAIAGWATVCMFCLYQPFISTWLGDRMLLNKSVVVGLSIYFYILKSGDMRWIYHEGAGLWYECRFIMVGEAITNIVLNIILCRLFGILGIVLATTISVFVSNMILCPKVVFRCYFQIKPDEYWMDHIKYFFTMIITAGISYGLCENILPGIGVKVLIERLLICTVVSVIVFWSIWNRSDKYSTARIWINNMLRVKFL